MKTFYCFFVILSVHFSLFAQANYTSGTLIGEEKSELKLFNNLYTQTQYFGEDGNKLETGNRETYFTAILTYMHGYTHKVDVGFDLYPKYVKKSSLQDLTVEPQSRAALAAIAPKIKFQLSDKFPNLTAQSTIVIPTTKGLEGENGEPFLAYDDVEWWNQVYYQKQLNEKWLFFGETGVLFRYDLAKTNKVHEWIVPVKVLLQYSPSSKFTAYSLSEIAPSSNHKYYTQVGLGAKYQLSNTFLIETLGTTFPIGKNAGAGSTLNLGFRAVF